MSLPKFQERRRLC